jgi:hypothetical protein
MIISPIIKDMYLYDYIYCVYVKEVYFITFYSIYILNDFI